MKEIRPRPADTNSAKGQTVLCPRCLSSFSWSYGRRGSTREYLCRRCGRKFNDRGCPIGMRTPNEQLGVALSMFYEGFSLAEICLKLGHTFNNPVNPSSVHRWVIKYTNQALASFSTLQIQASHTWLMDETTVKISGQNVWVWDVVDFETHFLLASHLAKSRSIAAVKTVVEMAREKPQTTPQSILYNCSIATSENISLSLPANFEGIQLQGLNVNATLGFTGQLHTALHQRNRVMQNLRSLRMATLVLNGFSIHYNFFRPSKALKNRTPAAMAGVSTQCKDWLHLVANSDRVVNERNVGPFPLRLGR